MSTVYPDMPSAMVGWLRAQPTVVAAFGDDPSALATTKFWGDEARRGVQLPWAVYQEVDRKTTYMTRNNSGTPYIADGVIRCVVVGAGKEATRDLARLVATGLTNAKFQWQDGRLMMIQATSENFVPNDGIAPDYPNAYVCVVGFAVQYNGMAP